MSPIDDFSTSSSSGDAIDDGVTYLNECRTIYDIANPVHGNDVNMQFLGHFDQDWGINLDFDKFGYGLKTKSASRSAIFCNDASKLFSSFTMSNTYL